MATSGRGGFDDDEFERLQVDEAIRASLPPPPSEMPSDYSPQSGVRSPTSMHRDLSSSNVDTLFDAGNVSLETQPHTSKKGKIPGRVKIVTQKLENYLMWEPKEKTPANLAYSQTHKIDLISRLQRRGNLLFILLKSNCAIPPLCFDNGAHALGELISTLQARFNFRQFPTDPNSYSAQPPEGLLRSVEGLGLGAATAVGETISQVKYSFLTGLAKVAQFTSKQLEKKDSSRIASPEPALPAVAVSSSTASSLGVADRLSPATLSLLAQAQEEERDMQCRSQAELGELGAFDIMDSMDAASVVKGHNRTEPVTRAQFESFFNHTGAIQDELGLRQAIFYGGCAGDVRRDAWCFLLHHWPPSSDEADAFRAAKVAEYNVYKTQWKTVTPAQLRYNHLMQEFLSRVRKDVERTDREHPFFAGDDNANIETLNDMLMSYCMYNYDLGYVQGMSDMMAVIYVVMEDEVDTFWCFVNWMEKMRHNFAYDQSGMQAHLKHLALLVRFMDPELMEAMERNDSANLYFCFRWLLINFKREFHLNEIMILWETFWTEYLSPRYELFVCLAIIERHRAQLMAPGMGFDEIVQFVNTLAYSMDLTETLKDAEGWYLAFSGSKRIPENLQPLLKTWIDANTPDIQ